MVNVAIVGAGPAGSTCAYMLAQQGIHAYLFDHSHPREKPCGGMVPAAIQSFPILEGHAIRHNEIVSTRLISPGGRNWKINLRKKPLWGVLECDLISNC